jgi:photosystem II stability/assembly factor-like uncharacterized protein
MLIFLLLLPTLAFPAWVKQVSGTGRNLRSVWFFYGPVYPFTVVAVGDSGTILTSTDLGQTWTQKASPTTQTLYAVGQDLNGNLGKFRGSAVGGDSAGVILNTTDDGSTWTLQATPPAVMHTVAFSDSFNGLAAGASGLVWWTTDGGVTWSLKSNPLSVTWYGIWKEPYNVQPGWICGENGTIMGTTSAGASWKAETSGTTAALRALSFMSDSTGVVAGDSGTILRTTNAGSTWTPVPSGVTDDLFAIYYGGPYQQSFYGFTVGANGRILRGSWDGSTWVAETSGATRNLRGVHYTWHPPTGLDVWAVGDSGTILYEYIPFNGVEISSPPSLTPNASRLTVFPNPFTSFATLRGYEADHFVLYDVSGRRVGTYRGDRVGEGLAAGVYFLKPEGKDAKPLRVVKLR